MSLPFFPFWIHQQQPISRIKGRATDSKSAPFSFSPVMKNFIFLSKINVPKEKQEAAVDTETMREKTRWGRTGSTQFIFDVCWSLEINFQLISCMVLSNILSKNYRIHMGKLCCKGFILMESWKPSRFEILSFLAFLY